MEFTLLERARNLIILFARVSPAKSSFNESFSALPSVRRASIQKVINYAVGYSISSTSRNASKFNFARKYAFSLEVDIDFRGRNQTFDRLMPE